MIDTKKISELLSEASQIHHKVYRIVDGDDADWPIWYANWLIDLSELPQMLGGRPVKSELTYVLVDLAKRHAAEAPDQTWQDFYAAGIAEHFSSSQS